MEFVETDIFKRQIDTHLDDEGRRDFFNELLANPKKGALVKKSGGLRKVRVSDPGRGKGKRSGTRVIYYFARRANTIYLLLMYSKDEQDDLTQVQLKVLRQVVKEHLT